MNKIEQKKKEQAAELQVKIIDNEKLKVQLIRLDTYPDTVISGAVKEISQTAVKASWMAKAKIFRVVISLDRTVMEIMRPGMSTQVSVIVSETQPELLIPRSAVKFDGESGMVTRIEGPDTQRPVAITILAADITHYLVASNGALKEGDRILANQNF